jgi:hypothetical protein
VIYVYGLRTRQLHRVLKTSGVRLSGRTQKRVSPLTKQVETYHETYGIYVTNPSPVTPDLDAVRARIDNDLISQSVDGFCDEILVIQGVTNDTYKPRTWIAENQPTLEAKYGTLIAPIVAIVIAIAVIVASIAAVIGVLLITSSFTTIAEYIMQPPKYVGGTPENPETYDSYAQYLSSQHNLYWYVCPKCGAGFGSKLDYPNVGDVPQDLVDLYNEHVEICLGIPTGPQNVGEFLMFAALGVGGIIAVGWVITSIIKRSKEK